jgi:hypothetical protein
MGKSFSRNLQYFPAELSVWMQKAQLLSSEELGDVLKACLISWSNAITGGTPGALPDDDRILGNIIGANSKRRLQQLRQSFTRSETPGVLVCTWLADLFAEKQRNYQSVSERGRNGARKKGSPAKAQLPRTSKPSSSRNLQESNSSFGGGTDVPPPPEERAVARPPGQEAAAAPRDVPHEREADAWVRSQPPEVLAEIEREVDEQLRAEIPRRVKLSPDGPMYAAVRARKLAEATARAYMRSRLQAARYFTREVPCADTDPPSDTTRPAFDATGAGRSALELLEVPVA